MIKATILCALAIQLDALGNMASSSPPEWVW